MFLCNLSPARVIVRQDIRFPDVVLMVKKWFQDCEWHFMPDQLFYLILRQPADCNGNQFVIHGLSQAEAGNLKIQQLTRSFHDLIAEFLLRGTKVKEPDFIKDFLQKPSVFLPL